MTEEQTVRLLADVKDISGQMTIHGETLTRLDERSIGQKERMDRIQKQSAGIGAATGTVMGAFTAVLVKVFGGPSA